VKVLVAGWFSFADMGATAGDLLALQVVCGWLDEAERSYDIATVPPFQPGVNWKAVEPSEYSDVVFVCGPMGNGWPIPEFLAQFPGARLIGVDLSMLEPLAVWNPFDLLLERDSSESSMPDIALLSDVPSVPVVGVVLVHVQKEYRSGAHDAAQASIRRLLSSRSMAAVEIDTRLDVNAVGLRTPAEVESLIAKMDVVVTTRLHGLVLSLKHGVPAVAIDPIPGGAKLQRQARTLGWPHCFTADVVSDIELHAAFEDCLRQDMRIAARHCAERARARLGSVRQRFVESVSRPYV